MTTSRAPILYNCTTDDVRVYVNGTPVSLPRGPVPVLLHTPDRPLTQQIRTNANTHTSIRLYTANKPIGVLELPPYQPDAWYLVDADAIREFPWRTDFVTPAMWEYIGGFGDQVPDDLNSPSNDFVVLVGVTRAVHVTATADMPVLDWGPTDA